MRSLGLLVSLALSPLLHAAASVRLSTPETRVTTGREISIAVQNDGTEAIVDAVVAIELDPGLELKGAIRNDGGWICGIQEKRKAACRLPSFDAGATHTFIFNTFVPRGGGNYDIHASASGRNLPATAPILINVTDNTELLVTTASDFGAGSLRAAIETINGDPVCGSTAKCTIRFAAPMTIAPAIPLPPIRKCNVEISGGTGIEAPDQPKPVVISGENATWGNGLEVRATCAELVPGVQINSLVISSWPWNGIYFEAPAPHGGIAGTHSVRSCFIGMDAMGREARPNRGRGIVADSPYERLGLFSNIISGNSRSGVALFRGQRVDIVTNKIGINRFHEPLGNGASGVFSAGVPVVVGSNIIAYNAHAGVAIARGTPMATVTGNELHSNGGLPIDWGLDDRTPPDDEDDRVLNAPEIRVATFRPDLNVTLVEGVVRLRRGVFGGAHFTLTGYIASTERGDVVDALSIDNPVLDVPVDISGAVDVEFGIVVPGDQRGRLVALQTVVADGPRSAHLTSEISKAVLVQ